MTEIHVALLGLDNVGRAFAEYCRTTGDSLSPRLNIRAVADSSGGLILDSYEDLDRILDQKSQHRKLSESAPAPLLRDAPAFSRSPNLAGIPELVECIQSSVRS